MASITGLRGEQLLAFDPNPWVSTGGVIRFACPAHQSPNVADTEKTCQYYADNDTWKCHNELCGVHWGMIRSQADIRTVRFVRRHANRFDGIRRVVWLAIAEFIVANGSADDVPIAPGELARRAGCTYDIAVGYLLRQERLGALTKTSNGQAGGHGVGRTRRYNVNVAMLGRSEKALFSTVGKHADLADRNEFLSPSITSSKAPSNTNSTNNSYSITKSTDETKPDMAADTHATAAERNEVTLYAAIEPVEAPQDGFEAYRERAEREAQFEADQVEADRLDAIYARRRDRRRAQSDGWTPTAADVDAWERKVAEFGIMAVGPLRRPVSAEKKAANRAEREEKAAVREMAETLAWAAMNAAEREQWVAANTAAREQRVAAIVVAPKRVISDEFLRNLMQPVAPDKGHQSVPVTDNDIRSLVEASDEDFAAQMAAEDEAAALRSARRGFAVE